MELSNQLKVMEKGLHPSGPRTAAQMDERIEVKAYGYLILAGRSGRSYAEWTPTIAGMDEQVHIGVLAGQSDDLLRAALNHDKRISGA